MADGYDVKTKADGQVIIVLHADCQITKDEILTLLREVGINDEMIVFLDPNEAVSCTDLDDTAVIIPLDAKICDMPELETAALRCSDAGGRVIAIFGPEFSYDGMHPIADKYGTQCGWSQSGLSSCIAGPETNPPLDVTDSEVPRPQAKQVKCH